MTAPFTIVQIPLPETGVGEVEIPEPGIIRYVAIGAQQAAIANANGKQMMRERVVLFVEIAHGDDTRTRRRKFVQMAHGIAFQPPDDATAHFRGVALSINSGAIVYVYELVKNTELLAMPSAIAVTS